MMFNDNDPAGDLQDFIEYKGDYILEAYVDSEPEAPESIYEGVFDDDYPEAYEKWLESLTIDDVPDEFCQGVYEDYLSGDLR